MFEWDRQMTIKQPRYIYPRISKVQLHSFSLYRLEPDISLVFDRGVMCLAGANGIGKSTFLATVNYGLTGAVPTPNRRMLSTGKYFQDALEFTSEFFRGRIDETDREMAAVSVEFSVGNSRYSLTRGIFDNQSLRSLVHTDQFGAETNYNALNEIQREAKYRELLASDIGLNSFEQFVFLQHFLLTFDEGRHLIFWDQAVSEAMLHLCFGSDPQDAERANQINREMERAGSWGRNLQFQVNNLTKRIDLLEQSSRLSPQTEEAIANDMEEYATLTETVEAATRAVEASEQRLDDIDLKASQLNAEVTAYRAAYADVFDRMLGGNAERHPIIVAAMTQSYCEICNTTHERVKLSVADKLSRRICPLCETEQVSDSTPDPLLQKELAETDEKLTRARNQLEVTNKTRVRLVGELKAATDTLLDARQRLAFFEDHRQDRIEAIKAKMAATEGPVAQNLLALKEARSQILAQRQDAYAERDKYREELRGFQRKIEQSYAVAEETFVPRIRQLAELFLGIDVDVKLSSLAAGLKLDLDIRGIARRLEHQLSESQRFFVDIALRMALIQQTSTPGYAATIFIDTPEGSLDIAYEDRAGDMFSRFVKDGYDMLMTANINSSKLLTTLARNCGTQHMRIVPMTGWTELSDVQQQASELFASAFDDITAALSTGSGAA